MYIHEILNYRWICPSQQESVGFGSTKRTISSLGGSDLTLKQVIDHVLSSELHSLAEIVHVESRCKNLNESEGKHRGDIALSKLEGERALRHGVMLLLAVVEPVLVTRKVALGLGSVRERSELLTGKNGEVVIREMGSSVSISTNRGTEEN